MALRAGTIEALLILGLVLAAAPIRQWLENRFHKLFEREAALYRDVVGRIGQRAGQHQTLAELLRFVEERAAQALELRRVRIVAVESEPVVSAKQSDALEVEEEALTKTEEDVCGR